jgi:hypothetical protein
MNKTLNLLSDKSMHAMSSVVMHDYTPSTGGAKEGEFSDQASLGCPGLKIKQNKN